ncbi:MAG TPA: sulfur oxidation c-type cytochrome SoxX [Burkholderiales bacterium]
MKTMKLISIAIAAALLVPTAAMADPTDRGVISVHKRDFHTKGQAKAEWVVQDAVQRICTQTDDKPPAELAKALEADQMKTIPFPTGNMIGDWKKGAKIAADGRGMTWNRPPSTNNGGGCYNCHQLSPEEVSFGTLGPSLKGFGKVRGSGADTQKYLYGKIWNSKAYNLCSGMPRFGHSGTLTDAQIRDLIAYLLDPASPVNK